MGQNTSDSWAKRNGFSDWALALLWIIVAFILFQIVAAVVGFFLISYQHGLDPNAINLDQIMNDHIDLLFVGNSTGQILFLGLATWFVARLHTSKADHTSFLRFNFPKKTWRNIAVASLLIIAIQPAIWFLSWLNAHIPVPEALNNMQSSQMQMIENYLRGDHILLFTLFHVALVPAICEETLYRGYVMRAFQKSWGIWPAIIVSGLLFGLYHVQLSNLLPLASIGVLLAYITWVTESIYPAMVAHFINNGGSVIVGSYYPESAFAEITPESLPPIWAVIISGIISAYLIYKLYEQFSQPTDTRNSYV